jgi:two-component system, NtrC family, sensor histidine kinase KinB
MLRTRLFLNLLPFVLVLLAIGLYAIVLFSRLATSIDAAVGGNYRSVLAAQQMASDLAELDREVWAESGTRGTNPKAFAQGRRRVEQHLDLLLTNACLPGEKELDRQLSAHFEAYSKALAGSSSLTEPEGRHRLYVQLLLPHSLKIRALLDQVLDLNRQAVLVASQRVQKITREVTRLMVLGMAVALAFSAYSCYRLSRSILRPIQLVTTAARDLGQGKLNQPVPVVSRGELGELALAFNKMAAQLEEYRHSTSEQIVRLHRTMETTLASFPDPIFVLDGDGRIELRNPAASELASSLQLNGELPGRLQTIARDSLASGQHFLPDNFKEAVSYRIHGTEKFFLPRVLTMRTKEDALFGVAVVLYDVTRFRLLDAAKSDLVATVSHELKSPLTSVRMVIHILLEKTVGPLTSGQDELLQAAREDTERLLRILNDLLDLARLEEGDPGLHFEAVAPAELLQETVEDLAEKASAKALKLDLQLDPGLPEVSVDRQRINHVFANLLTNAIKHSPAGGEVLLRATRAGQDTVEFSITDQGPGIREEYQARIFERFFRAPGQVKPGAGLGLSIAREITTAHGGRLWVKSTPRHGATFFLALKTAAQAHAAAEATLPHPAEVHQRTF